MFASVRSDSKLKWNSTTLERQLWFKNVKLKAYEINPSIGLTNQSFESAVLTDADIVSHNPEADEDYTIIITIVFYKIFLLFIYRWL